MTVRSWQDELGAACAFHPEPQVQSDWHPNPPSHSSDPQVEPSPHAARLLETLSKKRLFFSYRYLHIQHFRRVSCQLGIYIDYRNWFLHHTLQGRLLLRLRNLVKRKNLIKIITRILEVKLHCVNLILTFYFDNPFYKVTGVLTWLISQYKVPVTLHIRAQYTCEFRIVERCYLKVYKSFKNMLKLKSITLLPVPKLQSNPFGSERSWKSPIDIRTMDLANW